MDISKNGLAELASYEALILSPYLDSGGCKTIGIGATKSEIKDLQLWSWDKILTVEEALSIYKVGIKKYVGAVNKGITMLSIKQHQFDALVSLCFNIGEAGFLGSTALRYINAGRSDKDVIKAIKKWNMDNGKVVQGLINRRQKECDLFVNGVYASGGMVDLVPVNPVTHFPVYKYGKKIKLLDYL